MDRPVIRILLRRALRRATFAALILLSFPSTAGMDKKWDIYRQAFDAYVQQQGIVGASTILVHDGRLVFQYNFGLADHERGQAVDGNTIFHYGSITKTLTAITLLQLRDRGKLSLDDPVTHYLPEVRRLHNPYGSPDDITLRMLLEHSSGLQNATWPWKQGQPWEPFEPMAWEQLVAMLPYQQLAFAPGSRYSYSNPAWIYLARVVEVVTGDPWLNYVNKNLFAPLGMTRSYFGVTPYYLADHRSNNYTALSAAAGGSWLRANGRDFDPGITNPNSGWNAPLRDVARYMAFLGYVASDDPQHRRSYRSVLAHETLHEMWQPRHRVSQAEDTAEFMGLGFFVLPRGRTVFVGHTGSQKGFTSFLFINPATGIGIAAVFNTRCEPCDPETFRRLCETALEAMR
ncbi:beta-lactamase family protein [Luteimonas sp. SX5]|uniref:Beta-lactamase family protein n=1 Tax=Luteimonas galliterrae TaxID=2940486 RepID=A0ABT0MJ74_9GAMM|nr:serine hydrolase domain-containing protein [Luteimonas galliterrae]MCL1634936.1 beta-lactamase family protein [Luteimonas galliterrae]